MNILFILIAAVLTIGATVLVAFPLLRPPSESSAREEDKRLAVYRQQLAELEQERTAHSVSQEQYEQARHELERRVLDEAGTVTAVARSSRWNVSARTAALALIVTIPAAAFLLYWVLGTPAAIVHPGVQNQASPGSPDYDHQTIAGLDALTDRLKQRMAQNPGDGPGWALLARSYVELGRHGEAAAAFEKALALIPEDAQLLADYADALAMAQGRKLEGRPEELVKRALVLDPSNVKGLLLAGTIAYDRKEFATALKDWEKAQRNLPAEAGSELRQELTNNISEVRGLLGLAPLPTNGAGATQAAKPAPPVVSSGDGLAITGTVTLAPKLAAKASPADTLFVFARAVDGPPMPLAIVRATKQDLPFSFRLDDSTSPMPASKLSNAGFVVIVARLSKSGEATPKSGDLQGMSRPVAPGTRDLRIVIDSELP